MKGYWTVRQWCGDLTLALRVLQERDRGHEWRDPAIVEDAAEVERRHIAAGRRREHARHRRRA